MADHNIDILIRARDEASKVAANVNRSFGRMASSIAKSRAVAVGVGVGLERVAEKGIGAAFGVIQDGLDHLAERQDVITSTQAAIKATGNAARVSADDIRAMSEQFEASSDAFVDDKAIQAGANALLRFKAVAGDTFKRALGDAVDLGAGLHTGPEAAARLLGKSLADPAKAMGALRKAGIVLTDAEQKRIKLLVKGNRLNDAQAVILEAVEKRYRGAAKAAGGPAADSLNKFHDAIEDTEIALATGLAPALSDIRDEITTALADPTTQSNIKNIGKGLGDAARAGLEFAKKIPWGAIGDALRTAADWAGRLFDAFRSLPPGVQATIIGLAGLNKLSGGAIGSIVGDLGKGLIKGVLGMTAGVVNINAGVVNGGGLPGGLPGGAAAGAGEAAGAAAAAATKLGGTAGIVITDMHQFNNDVADRLEASGTTFGTNAGKAFRAQANQDTPWDQILAAVGLKSDPYSKREKYGPPAPPPGAHDSERERVIADPIVKAQNESRAAFEGGLTAVATKTTDVKNATDSGSRNVSSSVLSGTSGTTAATNLGADRIVSAISSMPTPVTNVNVSVSPTTINKYNVTQSRAGSVGGSRSRRGSGNASTPT